MPEGFIHHWKSVTRPVYTNSVSKTVDDVVHQAGKEVGLKRVRSATRIKIAELWAAVQQKELDLLDMLNN